MHKSFEYHRSFVRIDLTAITLLLREPKKGGGITAGELGEICEKKKINTI